MRLSIVRSALLPLSLGLAGPAAAQDSLNPTAWGVVYDLPATRRVTVRRDVPFLEDARGTLTLDLYQPPDWRPGERRPVVVFLNTIGNEPGNPFKRWAIYQTWPRLMAAHGMIGISMDNDETRIQAGVAALFRFLATKGTTYGADPERIGVYAASANVTGAAEYLMSDSAAPGIRAAVLYYGATPAGRIRADLPVQFVVAASDVARMGPALPALWQRVIEAGAPWSLVYGARMPHAFDAFTDTDDARRLVRQTIGFWRAHLEPVPQPPWSRSAARDLVAALYANDPARAVELLGPWIERHPGDVTALREYARSLAALQRFPESETAYLRAYALDSTDIGVVSGLATFNVGSQRWDVAARYLERAIGLGARSSQLFGQLGFVQLHLGRNAEAAQSYERAFEIGIPPGAATRGVAWYNLACAYARLGRVDDAFAALGRAVDEGMRTRQTYERDTDLDPLRPDPRFAELLARLGGPAPG